MWKSFANNLSNKNVPTTSYESHLWIALTLQNKEQMCVLLICNSLAVLNCRCWQCLLVGKMANAIDHFKCDTAVHHNESVFLCGRNGANDGVYVCVAGDIETGVDHLSNAVAVCGQPQQLLQVLQQTLPPQVFQMLLMKLPVAGQVSQ